MIPQADLSGQTENWQEALINSVRDSTELCALLQLKPEQLGLSPSAAKQFPVKVPRTFVSRMKQGDPNDPLLLQVLNLQQEELAPLGYSADPLHEIERNPAPGLIHKYAGRVLLIVSGNCAIHCRYCFRRHFPYDENNPGRQAWQEALNYIRQDASIHEVIYSGGDPLSAPDRHLQWLTEQLAAIPHLKRLRIHTRLPVVIPQRITPETLTWMRSTRLQTVVVLHINHANEIDPAVMQMVAELHRAGITLLNQAVLLKGVNDQLQTLVDLSEALFASRILPYYLHLLDPVLGSAHFETEGHRIEPLYKQLQAALPGYLVPKLVRETITDPNKMLVIPSNVCS